MRTIKLNGKRKPFREWPDMAPGQIRNLMEIAARNFQRVRQAASSLKSFDRAAFMKDLRDMLAILTPDVDFREVERLPLPKFQRFIEKVARLSREVMRPALEALPELAVESAEIFRDVDNVIRAKHGIESAESCLEKAAEVRRGLQSGFIVAEPEVE